MTAVHNLGVDRRHHERCHPLARQFVALRNGHIWLVRAGTKMGWRKCVWVLEHLAQFGILRCLRHHIHQAGDRAAAGPTASPGQAHANAGTEFAESFDTLLLREPHAHIGWNRIEST